MIENTDSRHRNILVTFDRRCHNPVLHEAPLDKNGTRIPWLGRRKTKLDFA